MKEIKMDMTFWEWFQTICKLNDIELDEPIVNEMIGDKMVTVTPRQFYEWHEDTGDDAKSMFTVLSMRHADEGTLLDFWTGFIRHSYEFDVPIVELNEDKGC